MNNLYQVLGLKSGASQAEIKGAYRRLAKKYHPDISREPDAEEKFIEITEAYELLLGGGGSSTEIESSGGVYTKSNEEIRRERARAFARMRYDTFKKNNEAFQKAWYFNLVKYGIYLLIAFFYSVGVGIMLAPLWAWLVTRESFYIIPMVIVSLFSLIIFKHTYDLQKAVKPYISNYN